MLGYCTQQWEKNDKKDKNSTKSPTNQLVLLPTPAKVQQPFSCLESKLRKSLCLRSSAGSDQLHFPGEERLPGLTSVRVQLRTYEKTTEQRGTGAFLTLSMARRWPVLGRAHPDGISPSDQANPSSFGFMLPSHRNLDAAASCVLLHPPNRSARSAQGLPLCSARGNDSPSFTPNPCTSRGHSPFLGLTLLLLATGSSPADRNLPGLPPAPEVFCCPLRAT